MLVAKITDGENFRFRVPAELKRAWVEMCEARRISQQDAITALMWFTTLQDSLTQGMLLRQQPARDDLLEVVLRRIQDGSDDRPVTGAPSIQKPGQGSSFRATPDQSRHTPPPAGDARQVRGRAK